MWTDKKHQTFFSNIGDDQCILRIHGCKVQYNQLAWAMSNYDNFLIGSKLHQMPITDDYI